MSPRAILVFLATFVIVANCQRFPGGVLTNIGDLFGYDVFRRPRIVIALPPSIQLAPVPPAPAPAAAPAPAPAAGGAAPAAPAPAPAPAAAGPASGNLLSTPFGTWLVG